MWVRVSQMIICYPKYKNIKHKNSKERLNFVSSKIMTTATPMERVSLVVTGQVKACLYLGQQIMRSCHLIYRIFMFCGRNNCYDYQPR